jgi:hypothetical protein
MEGVAVRFVTIAFGMIALFAAGCAAEDSSSQVEPLEAETKPAVLVQFPEFEPELVQCWYPTVSEDNDQNCVRLATADAICLPVKDNICRRACSFISPYLRADASRTVASCVEATACGYSSQGQVVVECLDTAIMMGELPATATAQTACSTVGQRLDECGLDRSDFDNNCGAFARAFTPEAVDRIAGCASAACGDLSACVQQSNCVMGNLRAYHPGESAARDDAGQ